MCTLKKKKNNLTQDWLTICQRRREVSPELLL